MTHCWSVTLTEDQALPRLSHSLPSSHHYYYQSSISHQLTDKYRESLGPNGPFLHKLFHSQSQHVQQLQEANNTIKSHIMDSQDDISKKATKGMSSVAQAILMNMPTRSHLSRSSSTAKLESFNGSRDNAEQFIQSINIAVTMQLDTLADERMKSCMLSP